MDAKMITKMIREGILSEITILICDPPSDGKFLYCPKLTRSSFLIFFLRWKTGSDL